MGCNVGIIVERKKEFNLKVEIYKNLKTKTAVYLYHTLLGKR